MKIVVAPDSFKGSLSARQACACIAEGVRRVLPEAEIDSIPMADGGEGTVEALIDASGGTYQFTTVSGPLGEPVEARWGLMGEVAGSEAGPTAVIEMAAASGLPLVSDRKDPLLASTFGTGELIDAALAAGATRIIVGIGGSATNDGGVGAAQAVGVQFLDRDGKPCPPRLGGGDLDRVARIEMSQRNARLGACDLVAACDVDNPLCGPRGASAVYGPQKGATPENVRQLDANLAHLADLMERDLGCSVREMPGAGAAGGLGAGLVAFLGGRLRPGIDIVLDALNVEARLAGADLLITGEGQLDAQSNMGKVVFGLGYAAKRHGVPIVVLAGSIGPGATDVLEHVRAYFSIVNRPMDLSAATREAAALLTDLASNVMRTVRLDGT